MGWSAPEDHGVRDLEALPVPAPRDESLDQQPQQHMIPMHNRPVTQENHWAVLVLVRIEVRADSQRVQRAPGEDRPEPPSAQKAHASRCHTLSRAHAEALVGEREAAICRRSLLPPGLPRQQTGEEGAFVQLRALRELPRPPGSLAAQGACWVIASSMGKFFIL